MDRIFRLLIIPGDESEAGHHVRVDFFVVLKILVVGIAGRKMHVINPVFDHGRYNGTRLIELKHREPGGRFTAQCVRFKVIGQTAVKSVDERLTCPLGDVEFFRVGYHAYFQDSDGQWIVIHQERDPLKLAVHQEMSRPPWRILRATL